MHQLGQTRSAHRANYLLQTADTFVRTPLPGLRNGMAIIHASPALGARFLQYTAELGQGGVLEPAAIQRFVYVLEGKVTVGDAALGPSEYAYCPPGTGELAGTGRVVVLEKAYQPLAGTAVPAAFTGSEAAVAPTLLGGDPWLAVRALVPDDVVFDSAVNTMTYQPGASLSMVEIHVMEHGMLMLEGGGIYRLGDDWHAVTAGDFIWMGAYCPQWFGALGKTPAKYLIYKDWNRCPPIAKPE